MHCSCSIQHAAKLRLPVPEFESGFDNTEAGRDTGFVYDMIVN
jgi:hypothetical protein